MTCLLALGFSGSLYGPAGGLIALVVVGLSPDMLAHGRLVTPDVYLAAGMLGSLWAWDALARKPGWRQAAVLGVAVGVATLCKFTAFLLVLLLPAAGLLVWLLRRLRIGEEREPLVLQPRTVGWGLAALVIAMFTINLGYGFHGSLTPLGNLPLTTPAFCAVQGMLPAWLPVPLPATFVLGPDAQLGKGHRDAYLLGQFNQTGFWNYYLVGFLVKTPEPILLLALAALLLRDG